jgi:hypothetical protein
MTPLLHACKEWAAVCGALAAGRQSLLIRKGGVAEAAGVFQLEHRRFWLYPTFVHQQEDALTPDAAEFLAAAQAEQPPPGIVRLAHWAEASEAFEVRDERAVLQLAGLHILTDETIRARFAYRRPGLFVVPVRIYRSDKTFELAESEYYSGCKSWVELERELPTIGTPVTDDAAFHHLRQTLDLLLDPPAFA